jgi:FkbH-like protein
MYETEVNNTIESLDKIPVEVLSEFAELRGSVLSRTVLPWSEHCTECVWPTCYSTCELYSAREDGRCRRFMDGMVRIDYPKSLNSYLLKIRFKRWGKLWTPANLHLYSVDEARLLEQRDYRIGNLIQLLPLNTVKSAVAGKRYGFKKRRAQRRSSSSQQPTCFVMECYNPEDRLIQLSLTMRSTNEGLNIPFQQLIDLTPGFHRVRVPVDEISRILDLRSPFSIELIPNEVPDGTTLYFGTMDFIQEVKLFAEKTKTVKCVVWDLDNTLWDGILTEDGSENVHLKPGIPKIIYELDRRGILHSIASKNNRDEALDVLRKFRLDEYFLCPQISWQPKSEGIKEISRLLNIGIDTLMFVDDSQFELEEVKSVCPEIQLLKAAEYNTLVEMRECHVPVTQESKDRRRMYQIETKRQDAAEGFGQDYAAFLKHSDIRVIIRPLTEDNIERVHELTQRTNQMNFSGNRYNREVLKNILHTSFLDTYILECLDRFGSYGVVGFCIVDNREPRMTDLMFSCRIQSKRVEHAFLSHLLRKYVTHSGRNFHANYRKTPRNAPSGRVFTDLGMREEGIQDGVSSLVFDRNQTIPEDGIVQITLHGDVVPVS